MKFGLLDIGGTCPKKHRSNALESRLHDYKMSANAAAKQAEEKANLILVEWQFFNNVAQKAFECNSLQC